MRALTNTTGAVTDTYDYDAFGNLIHSTGTTPNVYLYSGEQFDPDLQVFGSLVPLQASILYLRIQLSLDNSPSPESDEQGYKDAGALKRKWG